MAVGIVGECDMGSVQHEVEITSEATVMQHSVSEGKYPFSET